MTHATHWIVGPGALGRLLAQCLATHQTPLLIGRRPLPARQTLITPEGERLTRELAVATQTALPGPPPDWVHLTTKATTAESAFAALATRFPPTTPLVLWQNGVGVQDTISAAWAGPVLCATTTEGAYVDASTGADSGVIHAGHGHTYVGALNGGHAELAARLARQLSAAGLPATAVDDIRVRLWRKLAVNAAINPLVARFRIRNGQLRDRPFRPMVEAVIDELAAIMAAEGIPLPAEAGTGGWHALVWRVVADTATNRASMLQDVLAGRPTEHEAILAPLLQAASRHGLATPQLAARYRERQGASPP